MRTVKLLILALVLVLAACGQGGPATTRTVLITHDYYTSGLTVNLGGTLVLREDGCLAVRRQDGTVTSLILPRNDSSWADGILTFHGKTYRLGEEFYSGVAGEKDVSKIGLEVPSGCTVTANPQIVAADLS